MVCALCGAVLCCAVLLLCVRLGLADGPHCRSGRYPVCVWWQPERPALQPRAAVHLAARVRRPAAVLLDHLPGPDHQQQRHHPHGAVLRQHGRGVHPGGRHTAGLRHGRRVLRGRSERAEHHQHLRTPVLSLWLLPPGAAHPELLAVLLVVGAQPVGDQLPAVLLAEPGRLPPAAALLPDLAAAQPSVGRHGRHHHVEQLMADVDDRPGRRRVLVLRTLPDLSACVEHRHLGAHRHWTAESVHAQRAASSSPRPAPALY